MRIVSLLPSATEILFAIGAGEDVVGVSFECDYPASARTRTIVSTSNLAEGLTPAEIDLAVAAALAKGEDLYRLDAGALRDLDADVVVTQDLCAVCAVDVTEVDEALAHLGCRADVVTLDPRDIEEVFGTIATLGDRTGRTAEATDLIASLRARIAGVMRWTAMRRRPRVAVLEWTDPPYAPGHWIPEMVELAGGDNLLGTAGEKSRRISWEEVRTTRPDVVVVAPCGYDLTGSRALADAVRDSDELGAVAIHAVDANASWARPGPRLVDGIEELARILHATPVT
ncbi:MAG: cobalamin-binding protein [Nocardioides sp.]